MNNTIILFLDINGVFNNAETQQQQIQLNKRDAYPVPCTIPLMRAIDKDVSITPVWLTHWGEDAIAWNRYSATKKWPVAYPLSSQAQKTAAAKYPEEKDKCLAIMSFLENHLYVDTVWLQDGFPSVNPAWAKENDVTLIDTTANPLRTAMNAKHAKHVNYIMDLIKGKQKQ